MWACDFALPVRARGGSAGWRAERPGGVPRPLVGEPGLVDDALPGRAPRAPRRPACHQNYEPRDRRESAVRPDIR